jgi:hypothetical protein
MLTTTKINSLKPKDKLYRVVDSHGLNIEVAVSGSKIWRHRYRFEGKPTMMSLGHFPEVSLLDARQLRDKNKQLINKGINPKIQGVYTSLNNESKESFKDMFIMWHEHMKDSWSNSYTEDVIQRADKYLLPFIGSQSVSSINSQDMLKLFRQIEQKGIIDTLQKVKGIASRVFKYCVGIGIIDFDPTRDLPADVFKKKKISHYATITNPTEIGGLLRVIENYKWSYEVGTALKLAPVVV